MRKNREVWLVDATTYSRILPPELQGVRNQFFRIESFTRNRWFGLHPGRGPMTYSAGLLQLGAILSSSGYKVRYFSLDRAKETILGTSRLDSPLCIGFGAVTPTVPICAELATLARKKYPNTRLILGGSHAMMAPKLTAHRFPVFNDIVSARDEYAASRLVSDKIVRSHINQYAYELLPFPLAEYGINLITSIGCSFGCSYCQDRLVPNRNLSKDGGLERIRGLLPARKPIHYCDSILGGSYQRSLEVCAELETLEHDFLLSCDLRIEMLTPELIAALNRSGFVEIRLGLDSADDLVLEGMNRDVVLNRFMRSLSMVREKSSLYVSVYFVTGLPGTDEATLEKNIAAIRFLFENSLANQIKHHIYVPYPSDNCLACDPRVKLKTDDWSKYDRNSYPVFELHSINSAKLWEAFIQVEREINSIWLSSLGITEKHASVFNQYDDYNTRVYLQQVDAQEASLRTG